MIEHGSESNIEGSTTAGGNTWGITIQLCLSSKVKTVSQKKERQKGGVVWLSIDLI